MVTRSCAIGRGQSKLHGDIKYKADPIIDYFRWTRSVQHQRTARVPLQNASDRGPQLWLLVGDMSLLCLFMNRLHTTAFGQRKAREPTGSQLASNGDLRQCTMKPEGAITLMGTQPCLGEIRQLDQEPERI
jgi:hypothetical protein